MPQREVMGVKFRKVGNNALKFALVDINEHEEAERQAHKADVREKPKPKKESDVPVENLQAN